MLTIPRHAHRTSYRVCYADTDRMGRLYHAQYFVLFERGRTELLRAAGRPYARLEDEGVFLPVRQCEARYYGSVMYDDALELHTWIARLRRASATFVTSASRQGNPSVLAVGRVELVCISAGGQPRPLSSDLAKAIAPFVVEDGTGTSQ